MRASVSLVLLLIAGLCVMVGSARADDKPEQAGPWTIIETSNGVFRINTETGTSDIFRDGDTPQWERIAEPEANAEPVKVSVSRLGATIEGPATLKRLEDGKVVEFKAVRISDVRPRGPFSDAGIQATDFITQAAGKAVATAADVEAALDALKQGETIALTLYRLDKAGTTGTCEAPKRIFEEVTVRPAGK